jgi:Na+-translocating ferredoxin:NAD+ oxidoreductase RnfC subunit
LTDPIADYGVVGAGGAGFPTSVKLQSKAEFFIVNAAECEPLLHKDKELLIHRAPEMLQGLKMGMERVGASEGVIGIKEKYQDVITALRPMLPAGVRIRALSDTYPAGDEFILVFDVTGRVIPPGGLPLHVGAVVNNVETLVNIGLNRPVTHKFLTVAGAVRDPVTLRVPIGVTFQDCIAAAGGALFPNYRVLVGGIMMARLASDLEEPVTKTTGGLIVLPFDHMLIRRYQPGWKEIALIGRSACDQCSFCTELCPRYLLGHPIEPHKAMRVLGFCHDQKPWIAGVLYCCECNLCSLFSCPEDLDPKNVCAKYKSPAREQGLQWKGDPQDVHPHPLVRERRIPTRRLMQKFGLTAFVNKGPLREFPFEAKRVVLLLQQHIGAPALPVVQPGQKVKEGDLVAAPEPGKLGANIHASISGTVRACEPAIIIEA